MNMQYSNPLKMLVSAWLGAGIMGLTLQYLQPTSHLTYSVSLPRESIVAKYRPLDLYILDHMKARQVKLSPAATVILSKQFARILEAGLSDRDDQEAFVLAVGNESLFAARATSPTGARGMAQIIPSYANDFSKLAGLGTVGADDLYDTEVSLTLGVALFKDLLRQSGGNRALALAYYNQGANGSTARAARSGNVGKMADEGIKYLAKQYLVSETERVRILNNNQAGE